MSDTHKSISQAREQLLERFAELENKAEIVRAPELKSLLRDIKNQPAEQRSSYGQAVNQLKQELIELIEQHNQEKIEELPAIDVTAPLATTTAGGVASTGYLQLSGPGEGTMHPIMVEIKLITDIFASMGFSVVESRQIDDDYHMFGALNFPENHPARDEYDTFVTEDGLILPAHTSTMQNRVLQAHEPPIATVIPGRTFRNEDLDATHEHTFHQIEGVFVDQGVSLGDMLGTIQTFLEQYFGQKLEYRTQPFYFPFVEPGLEYLIKMPNTLKSADDAPDQWLEVMGCGMIHPNVLTEAGLDPGRYSGFAWGLGIERMVMLKYGIDDIRHFMAGQLQFLNDFGVAP